MYLSDIPKMDYVGLLESLYGVTAFNSNCLVFHDFDGKVEDSVLGVVMFNTSYVGEYRALVLTSHGAVLPYPEGDYIDTNMINKWRAFLVEHNVKPDTEWNFNQYMTTWKKQAVLGAVDGIRANLKRIQKKSDAFQTQINNIEGELITILGEVVV